MHFLEKNVIKARKSIFWHFWGITSIHKTKRTFMERFAWKKFKNPNYQIQLGRRSFLVVLLWLIFWEIFLVPMTFIINDSWPRLIQGSLNILCMSGEMFLLRSCKERDKIDFTESFSQKLYQKLWKKYSKFVAI